MDDAYTYFDMFTRNRLEKHKYSSMRIQIDTEVLLRNRKTTIEEQWSNSTQHKKGTRAIRDNSFYDKDMTNVDNLSLFSSPDLNILIL